MSWRAVSWCLEGEDGGAVTIKPGDEHSAGRHYVWRVLLVLARRADDDGRDASPSQETIARQTSSTRRDVRKALARLEAQGLIEKMGEAIPRVRGTVYALPAVAHWSPDACLSVDKPPNSGGDARHSSGVDNFDNSGGDARHSSGNSGGDSGGDARHKTIDRNSKPREFTSPTCGQCEDLHWIPTAGGMVDRCPDCNPHPQKKRGTR